ncbi:hypothetical protein CC79DRAFT_1365238 [Sarocladium strictum]
MAATRLTSFTLFPKLHKELRLLVWEIYFTSPRIHVLHYAGSPVPDSGNVELTCTTLDPSTNEQVPSCVRTDINKEARDLTKRKKYWERLTNFTSPVAIRSVLDPRWRISPPPNAPAQPVDINWSNDLIYLCMPDSFVPFLSLSKRGWSSKIENLAIAQPWLSTTPALPGQDGRPQQNAFEVELLRIAQDCIGPSWRHVSVVLLPPKGATQKDPSHLPLDQYGFASSVDFWGEYGTSLDMSQAMDSSRVFLSMVKLLKQSGRHDGVVIRKKVDVDLIRVGFGEYARQRRPSQ